MNNVKIAIIGAANISSTVYLMQKLKEQGHEVTFIDEKDNPFSPTKILITKPPEIEPIYFEPYDKSGAFSSKHGKDAIYYTKGIAKRRKKNKNKKTHR